MFEYTDVQNLLDFCNRDFVRYRHIIHDLDPPCPEWDRAMRGYNFVDGKFVLTANENSDNDPVRYFVDSLEEISLLASLQGDGVRLMGEMRGTTYAELIDWCRDLAPGFLATTNEAVKDCLSEAFDIMRWREGGDYTVTPERFRERFTSPVRRLSADDRPMWRRFVEHHANEPIVSAVRGGSGAVIRDFEFMGLGLPIEYYVTQEGEDITGVLTVNPYTDRCDNISVLFVDPEHRREGLAHSLLSAATRSIFARGRQPAYDAAGPPGERPDLFRMLTGLGYSFVSPSWYWYA